MVITRLSENELEKNIIKRLYKLVLEDISKFDKNKLKKCYM